MLFGLFRMSVVLTRVVAPLRSDLAGLRADLRLLQTQVQSMSSALDNLKAAVAAQTAVDTSAVTLIQGIAAELKNVSSDSAVQALADQLTAAAAPLATAVSANSPVAPSSAGAPVASPGVAPTPAGTQA